MPKERSMKVLFLIFGCAIIYLITYLTYRKFFAKKVFHHDDKKTPAVEINDGNDYGSAKRRVLIG